jgi:hypothetical protein
VDSMVCWDGVVERFGRGSQGTRHIERKLTSTLLKP